MTSNKIVLECPFDLETVFSLQYSTEGLKGCLKWIIDHLAETNHVVADFDAKAHAKFQQVDKNTSGVAKNTEDIALMKKMISELEKKSLIDEKRVNDLNVTVENVSMNLSMQHRTVINLIEDHKELIDQHTVDIEELKRRIDEVPEQVEGQPQPLNEEGLTMKKLLKIFASKSPPGQDNTIKRIEKLEQEIENLKNLPRNETTGGKSGSGLGNSGSGLDQAAMDKIADLLKRVQSLETRADKTDRSLASHADNLADHERRIKALESMDFGGATTTVSGEVDTSAILKQVGLIRQEFVNFKEVKYASDLEGLRLELRGYTDKETLNLKNILSKKITDGIDSLKHDLDRLRAEYENFKNRDFKDLEARVTALEKKIQRLEAAFSNFKIPESSGGGVSQEAFRQLEQRVSNLEDAIRNLQNEFARWMKEMQDSLNQKADFAQMDKALQDRLSDIVKALTKQFADKADTRKALKIHEKQFQNLYNLIMSKGGHGENEEDAMFSKKPLGGMSCASCEKGLVDMYGKRVEFMPWNKLPFRDPAERIARVGQGFSKMLSMINPDHLSRYEQNSKMQHIQQPMHMSQNQAQGHQEEQFYDPNQQQDVGGRTHTRFPQQNQRFTTSDSKRPGSAQGRKALKSKARK